MRGRAVLAALLVASLGAPACGGGGRSTRSAATPPPGGVLVRFDDGTVAAEVVGDVEGRYEGLRRRRHLTADGGMLFVFPLRTCAQFVMEDTLIPLSIAFLVRRGGERFEVVALGDMTPCRASPCRRYQSAEPFDVALEVNQGWFATHRVGRGSKASVGGRLPAAEAPSAAATPAATCG